MHAPDDLNLSELQESCCLLYYLKREKYLSLYKNTKLQRATTEFKLFL